MFYDICRFFFSNRTEPNRKSFEPNRTEPMEFLKILNRIEIDSVRFGSVRFQTEPIPSLEDILLLASDGLFDNLYEDFIVQILNNHVVSFILTGFFSR